MNFTKLFKKPFILSVGSFTAEVEGCRTNHLDCLVSALQSFYTTQDMLRLRAQYALRSARTGLRIPQYSVARRICLLIALFTIATSSNAKELGRLFFTPEQRAQLDYSFAREARPDNDDRGGLILNGIVQKHGGKRTAWINGVPQAAGNSDEKTPESMPVTLPGQTKPIKLKVGQRVLLSPSANPDTTKPDTPKQDAAKP